MGNIRKQTIVSSILIYIGFGIGFINQYIYSRTGAGSFTPEQYGLTRIFFDFAQNMYAVGALGIIPVIYKFYPYYKDNLEAPKIDLMSWGLVVALVGFLLVLLLGWYFEPFFVRKFSTRSKLVVDYYFWMIPFAVGLLFFSVVESFCWALQKTIVPNFLKETVMRFEATIFIVLFYFQWIDFRTFIQLFSLQYFIILVILLIYLWRSGRLYFPLAISRVTRKFWKKMFTMQALTFGGTVMAALAATVDSLIIAGVQGLTAVAVYVWAQYAANLIQVPQRSIQAASAGVLAQAWKDKNYPEIHRIYQRSAINLLLMALFIFGNLWLNIADGMQILQIQSVYTDGLTILFILGIVRIIDAGTGLNAMVINTSIFWRFDCISGVVLLILRLPLTYYLIKTQGILGAAIGELVAYIVYNFIRFEFLRRKFDMQPFNAKTVYALLLATIAYAICFLAFRHTSGWIGILLRGSVFSTLMVAGTLYFKLTPDAGQMLRKVRSRK